MSYSNYTGAKFMVNCNFIDNKEGFNAKTSSHCLLEANKSNKKGSRPLDKATGSDHCTEVGPSYPINKLD
ncbi:unnamed protein product, partial [Larinioides sclopetarius]